MARGTETQRIHKQNGGKSGKAIWERINHQGEEKEKQVNRRTVNVYVRQKGGGWML